MWTKKRWKAEIVAMNNDAWKVVIPIAIVVTSPMWISPLPHPDNESLHEAVKCHCMANRSAKEIGQAYRSGEVNFAMGHEISTKGAVKDPLPEVLRRELNDVCLSSDWERRAYEMGLQKNELNPAKEAAQDDLYVWRYVKNLLIKNEPSANTISQPSRALASGPIHNAGLEKSIEIANAQIRERRLALLRGLNRNVSNPYYGSTKPIASKQKH